MTMNYINNWIYQLDGVLAVDAAVLPLPVAAIERLGLDEGVEYLVVLTGFLLQLGGGDFEVARIVGGAGGSYTLLRGEEGTAAAEWPAGTLIHAPVTAGQLSSFGTGATGPSDSGWITLSTAAGVSGVISGRKIGSVVYLRGEVSFSPASAFVDTAIVQLPSGWEPAAELVLYTSNRDVDQNFSITPAGQFIYGYPNWTGEAGAGSLAFDGMSFPVG